jgi:hypothetical protein
VYLRRSLRMWHPVITLGVPDFVDLVDKKLIVEGE